MRRRHGLAALLLALPAAATAQDTCRTIRALTNADGRKFADLSVGIARDPYRITVRAGRGEPLPTPENCDLGVDPDDVSLSCYWRPGDYAASNAFYDSLFARFQSCLHGGLTAPSGPAGYGGMATALRMSETSLAAGGGETTVRFVLIEAAGSAEVPAHHYIELSVSHEPAAPDPEPEPEE